MEVGVGEVADQRIGEAGVEGREDGALRARAEPLLRLRGHAAAVEAGEALAPGTLGEAAGDLLGGGGEGDDVGHGGRCRGRDRGCGGGGGSGGRERRRDILSWDQAGALRLRRRARAQVRKARLGSKGASTTGGGLSRAAGQRRRAAGGSGAGPRWVVCARAGEGAEGRGK